MLARLKTNSSRAEVKEHVRRVIVSTELTLKASSHQIGPHPARLSNVKPPLKLRHDINQADESQSLELERDGGLSEDVSVVRRI